MLGSARPAAVLVGIALTATMLTAPGAAAGRPAAAPADRAAEPLTPGVIGDAPNPGAVHTGSRWVVATTRAGTAGRAFVGATRADEGWRRVGGELLTRMPQWARTDKSLWAPSIARRTNGSYLMFYSAVVGGTSLNRCIGTAWSNKATGPFTPHDRPLVCYAGSGTQPRASIPRLNPTFKLIDPTPTKLGNQWVLTFKTGYKSGQWRTSTRMLGLGGSSLLTVTRKPVTLTNTVDKYIEENPVIVKHGDTYTLFTSFGFYGQCRYWTRYRQNRALWTGWQRRPVSRLNTPGTTCGSGNAHVVQAPGREWLIFFNGHGERTATGSPDQLYVGRLRWHDGQPRVPRLIR